MTVTPSHWLAEATKDELPGGSTMGNRVFLVIHFTAGWSAKGSIDWWRDPEADGANAHIIIDRDGTVIQCRPFNRTAGHAGKSRWKCPKTGITYVGLNSCSIGIELANRGVLRENIYPRGMGRLSGQPIPRIKARHKNGGPIQEWEEYTPAQITACTDVAAALVKRYNLDDVIGHEDIAPLRRNDPGPAFPMATLRTLLGFRPVP